MKVRLTWYASYRDLHGCPKSLGSLWMVIGAPEGFISRGGNAADLWSEWNFKGWHWWCLSWRTIQRQEDQVGADFIPLRHDGGLTSDRRGWIPKTVNCPNHGVQLGPWYFWSFSMEWDPLVKTENWQSCFCSLSTAGLGRVCDSGWSSSSRHEEYSLDCKSP